MSGWISSKLKVSETLLQRFDQQATESLRKNEESSRSGYHVLTPPASVIVPKKKKKKIVSPTKLNHLKVVGNDENPKKSLTDTDWTQLLSSEPINGGGGDGKRLQLRSASNLLAFEKKVVGLSKSVRKSDVQRVNVVKDSSSSFVVDGIKKEVFIN